MRICVMLAVASFVLAVASPDATAQRATATVSPLRATSTPAQRFRARPASERLAVARQLTGGLRITINEEYFNAPFSVTPRAPDAVGRGWLNVQNAVFWYAHIPPEHASQVWAGPEGAIHVNVAGEANVHLANAQGHRFLVDCTVHGGLVRARTSGAATTSINAQDGAIISVVTAPGDDSVRLSGYGPFDFLGCEITRLQ